MLAEATDPADFTWAFSTALTLLGVVQLGAGRQCLLLRAEEGVAEAETNDEGPVSLAHALLGRLRWRVRGVELEWSFVAQLRGVQGVALLPPLELQLSEISLAALLGTGASALAGRLRGRARGVEAE